MYTSVHEHFEPITNEVSRRLRLFLAAEISELALQIEPFVGDDAFEDLNPCLQLCEARSDLIARLLLGGGPTLFGSLSIYIKMI